ncbi:VOC family protein [Aurantiacibacter flavus]|uniref:VOC family protein n=1 Tax=Aurantiacibacter flavus TaxID=3145232 RepID=A0ABV0CVQ8_9SPHN
MVGFPIWYELMTPEPAAVAPFYKATLGWDISASGNVMPNGSDYRMIARSDGSFQGGVLTLTEAMLAGGASPGWLPYFDVDDVQAWCDLAEAKGAKVWMVQAMTGVGTMAMVSDPEGVPFYVMKPQPPADDPDAKSTVFAPGAVGRCAWNERNKVSGENMVAFYIDLFDWTELDAIPMPEGHFYRMVGTGEQRIAAISTMGVADLPPSWLCYFRVANLAATRTAVETTGGTVVMAPDPVPGSESIVVAKDPGGALLAFVAEGA